MSKTFTLYFFLCCVVLISFASCDKYHAKKLAGVYFCEVKYSYWDMTPTNIDSTYNQEIEITQKGKELDVLGYKVHIDSLWNEKEYMVGGVHNYLNTLFRDDSVYITSYSGGLGGGATWKYAGSKIK